MTKGWTEERRKQQAERIRQTKPWEKSTGPKTEGGKARSALNAVKQGMRSRTAKELRAVLDLNSAFLDQYARYMALEHTRLELEAHSKLKKRILNQQSIPGVLK
jgi:hypothetical protein